MGLLEGAKNTPMLRSVPGKWRVLKMNAGRFAKLGLLLVVMCVGVLLAASFVAAQGSAPEPIVPLISQEDAEAFAARFQSIFDGPNLEVIDELFAEDYVGHLPLAPELDREGLKAYIASFYDALPDLRQETSQVIVGEDRVVLRVAYLGTHEGALFGVAPTGAAVVMTGTGIFSFDETGLVTENWAEIDVVGLLAQIGAFPPAPSS
jgi:predicted ester cyclase